MFDRKAFKKQWDKERRDHNNFLVRRWKKLKGCQYCGFKDHHAALVLDHIDPSTKCATLSKLRKSYNPAWSKDRLKRELAKCQVLCANCHHVRTYDEGHHWNDVNTKASGVSQFRQGEIVEKATRQMTNVNRINKLNANDAFYGEDRLAA